MTYEVGIRLNEQIALQLAADLAQIDLTLERSVQIDFRRVQHFEPFAMLVAGSAIRRFQRLAITTGASIEIDTRGIDPEGIAGYMGFWDSIGVALGRPVNSPAGKSSNLPITRIEVSDLYRDAGYRDPRGAGVVEANCQQMALVLAQPRSDTLVEALTYCFRELLRNVLEHAMTPTIWVCGMTWPKRDFVQVAVLDEGRGIRASLADHPEFRFALDEQAVRESLRPGVTRNKDRGRSRAELERWQDEGHILPLSLFDNAGYGLYMLSQLCREAGQFIVASGSFALAYIGRGEVASASLHKGTALRLVLEPTKVPLAFEQLFESVDQANSLGKRKLLTASMLRRLGLDSLVPGGSDLE